MFTAKSKAKTYFAWLGLFVIVLLIGAPLMLAQTAGTSSSVSETAQLAKLEQQVADAKGSADNAWMLTSSALVLMMTGPGLALFYGGLVRKKECAEHHDAELRHDGHHHGAVGAVRLQPVVWRRRQFHRPLAQRIPARRRSAARRGLRRHHSRSRLS